MNTTEGWNLTTNFLDCPRCAALIRPANMDQHIDWHTGVRDGFHPYRRRAIDEGTDGCHAEMRNSGGGAFWFCGLPPEHPYHQPLPEVQA